jgi:hypothetical protein
MQPIPQNYPIYKTLALEIFVECDPKEILNLRTALYNFYRLLEGTGEHRTPAGQEFSKYLTVAHLLRTCISCMHVSVYLYCATATLCALTSSTMRQGKLARSRYFLLYTKSQIVIIFILKNNLELAQLCFYASQPLPRYLWSHRGNK